MDALISSTHLIERLGREEQQLKALGLAAQALGIRSAIVIIIRETQAPPEPQPIEPSEPGS